LAPMATQTRFQRKLTAINTYSLLSLFYPTERSTMPARSRSTWCSVRGHPMPTAMANAGYGASLAYGGGIPRQAFQISVQVFHSTVSAGDQWRGKLESPGASRAIPWPVERAS
jgi:hypothetical protein